MRVLHVVIGGEHAGGQLVARKLIDGLRGHGHEGLLVSPTRGAFTASAERDGIRVHYVDLARTYRLRGAIELQRLIRRERIDLVHTHGMFASNVLSRLGTRAARVPVVSHAHGANVFRSRLAPAYRAVDNYTSRWCARIVAVSEHTRAELVAQGVRPSLVTVVYNGLDPPARPPEPPLAELGLPAGRLVVCVGRLESTKGQADLIRAARALADVTILFVGRDVGGHRSELESLARELGVAERTVFAGERDDVLALLAGADLAVLPSWREGFPLAPLEAMAVRRPVVATAVGGTSEVVVDGETGILVPPRDPIRLAEAIGALLDDPARARRLGEAGHVRLRERFSEARMVDAVLRVYSEACP